MKSLLLALAAVLAIALGPAAERTQAQGAYYGTQRKLPARAYSGVYSPYQRGPVRTFSLPTYGGGYYYGPRFNRGFYPAYRQPYVVYPPAVYYGY